MMWYVADKNPVMTNNQSQIPVKRLTCCNILGSEIPSGIEVSFENTVSDFLGSQLNVCSSLRVFLNVFYSAQSTRCSLTKCVQMSWLLYKTNIFHFSVGLYSDNAQRTSKHGKNISHATRLLLVAYFFVLTTFTRHLCVIKVQTHGKMKSVCS